MNSAFTVLPHCCANGSKRKLSLPRLKLNLVSGILHLKHHDYPSHAVMWFVCLINRHAGTAAIAGGSV
jgi:hypothetical protein